MAADNYKTEDHLTPHGWVRGTESNFGRIIGKEVPRPEDAVLTTKYSDYQRSGWSKSEISWEVIWRSPDISDLELQALFELFGEKPK